jgi:ribosomal protein S12 methylthiotransferase
MRLQSRIYQKRCKKMVGEELTVLVDNSQEDIVLGRTQWDAPDVDEVVLIKGAKGIKPGDMVKVRVTSFGEHKLFGELS